MMNVVDFLRAINGQAVLSAADGQILGLISSDQFNLQSICNPNGMYGSSYGMTSVHNPHGFYGGRHGLYSPYNPFFLQPPVIIYQNQIILRATKNTNLLSDVPLIDPDILFSVYVSGRSTNSATSVLDAYTQARIANANFIASLSSNYGRNVAPY